MIASSLLLLGLFVGSPFLSTGVLYVRPFKMFGALLTFAVLEQGTPGTNFVTIFFSFVKLFV